MASNGVRSSQAISMMRLMSVVVSFADLLGGVPKGCVVAALGFL